MGEVESNTFSVRLGGGLLSNTTAETYTFARIAGINLSGSVQAHLCRRRRQENPMPLTVTLGELFLL